MMAHNMYYIAVICTPEINEEVLRYKQWMKDQFGCIAALKSPAHVTLVPPFWLEDANEPYLQQTLDVFTYSLPAPEIRLDGFDHFRKTVLFIRVDESQSLAALKNRVEDHFMETFPEQIKKENRVFRPHVTIANRDMKPSHFEKAWEFFSKKQFNKTFPVKRISLLRLVGGKWEVIRERELH